MRTRTNSSVRSSWIAALVVGLAGVSLAQRGRAQEPRAQGASGAAPQSAPVNEPAKSQLSPEDADRKARALFEQGKHAFGDGQFRDAWDYFRQAYLLSKRPELLYNVGQSADRMRMDREALDAFRLYLERLPDAANRREVENRVRALEERLGETPSEPEAANSDAELSATHLEELPGGDRTPEAEPPPAPPTDDQPTRSGWYVRLSLGLGLLHDSVSNLAAPVTISSVTLASQIGVGYGVSQDIVIGGALVFDWSLAPSVNESEADLSTASLSLLMAFIDYYLEPRQDGWHLLGGLGFGTYSLSDSSATVGNENAGGIGFMAGGGYEWPVDDAWAIGALGRVVLAAMNQDTGHHIVFAPSVAFSAAWY